MQLLLQFILILSKLYWYFGHGLKICMWFGYNPQIIFVTFSQVELSYFSRFIYNKVNGQGYLVGTFPPTVFTDSLETSLVCWSWSKNMHMVWI